MSLLHRLIQKLLQTGVLQSLSQKLLSLQRLSRGSSRSCPEANQMLSRGFPGAPPEALSRSSSRSSPDAFPEDLHGASPWGNSNAPPGALQTPQRVTAWCRVEPWGAGGSTGGRGAPRGSLGNAGEGSPWKSFSWGPIQGLCSSSTGVSEQFPRSLQWGLLQKISKGSTRGSPEDPLRLSRSPAEAFPDALHRLLQAPLPGAPRRLSQRPPYSGGCHSPQSKTARAPRWTGSRASRAELSCQRTVSRAEMSMQ